MVSIVLSQAQFGALLIISIVKGIRVLVNRFVPQQPNQMLFCNPSYLTSPLADSLFCSSLSAFGSGLCKLMQNHNRDYLKHCWRYVMSHIFNFFVNHWLKRLIITIIAHHGKHLTFLNADILMVLCVGIICLLNIFEVS